MTTTHVLETAEVDIACDVHGPLPTADGRPPLLRSFLGIDQAWELLDAAAMRERRITVYRSTTPGAKRGPPAEGDRRDSNPRPPGPQLRALPAI